jgi:hypothetical protein
VFDVVIFNKIYIILRCHKLRARISNIELERLVSIKLNGRRVRGSCGMPFVLLAYNQL